MRFFALMSSSLALREGTAQVPDTPEDPKDLTKELRTLAKKLDVIERLEAYGQALRIAEQEIAGRKGHTFLLELDIARESLLVRSYDNATVAADEYSAVERAIENESRKDVVLVSVESLDTLRRAYPNYFLDTTAFVQATKEAIA